MVSTPGKFALFVRRSQGWARYSKTIKSNWHAPTSSSIQAVALFICMQPPRVIGVDTAKRARVEIHQVPAATALGVCRAASRNLRGRPPLSFILISSVNQWLLRIAARGVQLPYFAGARFGPFKPQKQGRDTEKAIFSKGFREWAMSF